MGSRSLERTAGLEKRPARSGIPAHGAEGSWGPGEGEICLSHPPLLLVPHTPRTHLPPSCFLITGCLLVTGFFQNTIGFCLYLTFSTRLSSTSASSRKPPLMLLLVLHLHGTLYIVPVIGSRFTGWCFNQRLWKPGFAPFMLCEPGRAVRISGRQFFSELRWE